MLRDVVGVIDPSVEAIVSELGLNSVRVLRSRSYRETLDLLKKADVQILLDTRHHGDLMLSKIPDYAESGRAILAVANSDSTTRHLIESFHAGTWVDNTSEASILEGLMSLRETDLTCDTSELADYCSPRRYTDSLKSLIATHGNGSSSPTAVL